MTLKLANNAISRLASSLTAAATTLSVTPGDGAKFPAVPAGDWFPLTIVKSDGVLEIVRCTARSVDTFTVTRSQEGTAAVAFSAGDRVELRLTAGAVDAKFQETKSIADNALSVAGTAQSTANAAASAASTADGKAVDAQSTANAAVKKSGDVMAGNLMLKGISGVAYTYSIGFLEDATNGALIYHNEYPGIDYRLIVSKADGTPRFSVGMNGPSIFAVRPIWGGFTPWDSGNFNPSNQPMIGVGQAWVNVIGSRVTGVTYTNSTSKPIMVSIATNAAASVDLQPSVDGVFVTRQSTNSAYATSCTACFIVPPGSTYIVHNTIGSITVWAELR